MSKRNVYFNWYTVVIMAGWIACGVVAACTGNLMAGILAAAGLTLRGIDRAAERDLEEAMEDSIQSALDARVLAQNTGKENTQLTKEMAELREKYELLQAQAKEAHPVEAPDTSLKPEPLTQEDPGTLDRQPAPKKKKAKKSPAAIKAEVMSAGKTLQQEPKKEPGH